MRVLMLGWEFPPHHSGGLGSACQGLTQGLLRQGAEVLFLMPSPIRSAHHQLGSSPPAQAKRQAMPANAQDTANTYASSKALNLLRIDSNLQPYQSAGSYAQTGTNYGPDLRSEVERFAQAASERAGRESFDVIHAHDWMTIPAALRISERCGKPFVWHVHSTEYDRRPQARALGTERPPLDAGVLALEQWGLDAAQRVVTVSQYAAEVLDHHYRLDKNKLSVIHNGLATSLAPGHQPDSPCKPCSERPLILFLGRLTEQKGPHWFLRAAARVLEQLPRARFVIAGEGDLHTDLLQLAEQLGIGQAVHFTGFLRGADVERMYALADVYVMPSISEPFGIAALEAIHAQVPVVLPRESGVREVIPSALSVDPTDVEASARSIVELCRDQTLREAHTRAALAELEPLRWERSAAQLLELFGELCP